MGQAMATEKSNIPALRFPEFKGVWELDSFGNKYVFIQTNSFSRALLNYDGGEVKNIHYGDIHTKFETNFDITKEDVPYINQEIDISKISKESYCQVGDLVIADASEDYKDVGKAIEIRFLNKEKLLAGLHTYIARCRTQDITHGFAGYMMQIHRVRLQIMEFATGISVLGISKGNLGRVKVFLPTPNEQKKIADFLTAVDQKIAQLTEKKSCLEQYKKGVMQRLFTQRLRFLDISGNTFPNWEIKKASDVFENYSNKDHDGTLPILAATQENGVVRRDGIGIDIKSSAESILSYKIVEVGNFVISLRSFQGGIEYSNMRGICSPAYTILREKIKISHDFFKFYFKREDFISRLSETVIGIRDGKQISYSAFAGMKLSFPSVPEQQKIADFLTAIDAKISALGNQLTAAQDFKKSLLQKMFV